MSETAAESVLPSGDDAREQWARWVFQIAPDLPAEDVRGQVLQRLAENHFLAPPAWRDAMALFQPPIDGQGARGPLPHEFQVAYERWLRRALEAFAGDFFDVPVARRRTVWTEFQQAAGNYPRLLARLDCLRPGLDVDLSTIRESDPRVRRLIGWVAGLFTSRPLTLAAMRRRFLRSAQSDVSAWQRAARRLRRRHPQIAALAPALIEQLVEAKKRPVRVSTAGQAARPVVVQSQSGSQSRWPVIVLVIAALSLFRVFSSLDRPKPSYPIYNPPTMPKIEFPITPLPHYDIQPPSTVPQADPETSRALSNLLDEDQDGVIHIGPDRFRMEVRDGRMVFVPVSPEATPTDPLAPPSTPESPVLPPGFESLPGLPGEAPRTGPGTDPYGVPRVPSYRLPPDVPGSGPRPAFPEFPGPPVAPPSGPVMP